MKLYLTALILGTCLILAGCPGEKTVETTEESSAAVSSAGPDKTDPDSKPEAEKAGEDD